MTRRDLVPCLTFLTGNSLKEEIFDLDEASCDSQATSVMKQKVVRDSKHVKMISENISVSFCS